MLVILANAFPPAIVQKGILRDRLPGWANDATGYFDFAIIAQEGRAIIRLNTVAQVKIEFPLALFARILRERTLSAKRC